MQPLTARARRVLLGAPEETRLIRGLTLPKRAALPVFGSDGLSALAYAPDEIIMVLALSGTAALALSPWVGLAIAVTLFLVVGTYRYNITEVARSGGDFAVVTERLGPAAGTAAGSSLLFDFVLMVAVSVSSASTYLVTLMPFLQPHRPLLAVGLVALLTLAYLRGARVAGRVAPVPTWAFAALLALTIGVGVVQSWTGGLGAAPSAGYELVPASPEEDALVGFGLALLLARAFSSGAVTLTGVESVSNAVPFFRPPRSRNAATTLMIIGSISAVALLGVLYLAHESGAVVTMSPAQLLVDGRPVPGDFHQMPVLGQVAVAVFGSGPLAELLLISTALLLLIAPAAAYIGFPILASSMADRGYLPVQLRAGENRSAYASGALMLGAGAAAVTAAFGADVNDLIQLYVLGVLFSMSLTQAAVLRSRHRRIRRVTDRFLRRRMLRDQAITTAGLAATLMALVIVLITKIGQGAWVTVLVVAALSLAANGIKRHYRRIDEELAVTGRHQYKALPARVHAMVVIPKLRRPALRALSYARATRPSTLEALVLNVDDAQTREIRSRWDAYEIPVPMTVLEAPYRDRIRPVLQHVRAARTRSPRDVVIVYLPEYIVERWWQRILHRRQGRRLSRALAEEPGVVTALVPWRLGRENDDEEEK
ncbi:APC family permease [Rothia halotolerans]|uniref:APC family permease n=1 Tax=Rothia halotolerans TaxID=405770 RepID=UPI00101DC16C|nr:amino acid permease [Rothia halotolerans]